MKIAVFHGTKGSPQGNWFPWLKSALIGHTVYIPALPTPDEQEVDNWVIAVTKQIPDLQEIDILIGHSCGASFIPHLLKQKKLHPEKCILVSPFSGTIGFAEYDALNRTFFLDDKTMDTAAQLCRSFIVFHGDNDPYVPLEQAKGVGKRLNAQLLVIKNGGHLNAEFGYASFPELLNVI